MAQQYAEDGLQNLVSNVGTSQDKRAHDQYVKSYITQEDLEALYFESWIARKAVDLVPDDETREWRTWSHDDPQPLYEAEKALGVREKVNLARKWERLYGGSGILLGTGGNPETPLDVAELQQGGLKYLHVFHRWELTADEPWDQDIASASFNKPLHYRLQLSRAPETYEMRIHRSRFVLFEGLDAPRLYREANDGWGLPLYQHLREAIYNAASTNANVAALINEAKLDVIQVPDLDMKLSDPEAEKRVIKRFALASQMKSTINTLLLGGEETFERKQTAFAGLRDLMMAQLQTVSGALDMPVTRFLGQSPQGLAASGETEMRAYYDMIRARQQTDLADALDPLDQALVRSVFGEWPEGLEYEWAELWTPTPAERAQQELQAAQRDAAYIQMGLFPEEGMAKAIRDRLIQDGTYPSLDQHVREEDLTFENMPEPTRRGDLNGFGGDDDEGQDFTSALRQALGTQ